MVCGLLPRTNVKTAPLVLVLVLGIGALLSTSPCAAQETTPEPQASKSTGFALQGAPSVALPWKDEPLRFEGRLAAGYKFERGLVTLGLELAYAPEERDIPYMDIPFYQPPVLEARRGFVWLVAPEVQVDVARFAADRLVLFTALRAGFGPTLESTTGTNKNNGDVVWRTNMTGIRFGYRLGFGVRWWVTPTFAVDALTGLASGMSFRQHRRHEHYSSTGAVQVSEEDVNAKDGPSSVVFGFGVTRVF